MMDVSPKTDWTVDTIETYVKTMFRRSAQDVWKIGKALSIARSKLKAKREWMAWQRSVGISTSTADRYIKLYESTKYGNIAGMTVAEVQRMLHPEPEQAADEVDGKASEQDKGRKSGSSSRASNDDPYIWEDRRRFARFHKQATRSVRNVRDALCHWPKWNKCQREQLKKDLLDLQKQIESLEKGGPTKRKRAA